MGILDAVYAGNSSVRISNPILDSMSGGRASIPPALISTRKKGDAARRRTTNAGANHLMGLSITLMESLFQKSDLRFAPGIGTGNELIL